MVFIDLIELGLNRGVEILSVDLDSVEVNLALVKIGQHDKLTLFSLRCIGKEIGKLMNPQRVDWRIRLNLHVFF